MSDFSPSTPATPTPASNPDVPTPEVDETDEGGSLYAEPDDGNALALDDDAYIGVDPAFQGYAEDINKPRLSEEGPERELEERSIEHQKKLAEQATTVGVTGVTVGDPIGDARKRAEARNSK